MDGCDHDQLCHVNGILRRNKEAGAVSYTHLFREMQGAPQDAAPQDGLSGEAAPRADAPQDAAPADDDAKGDEDKR